MGDSWFTQTKNK